MTTKTLSQLADEYCETVKNINEQIALCRAELDSAQKAHRNIAAASVMRRLTVLYNQRSELEEIAQYLKSYYSDEMRCAV